ncbi:hypothetical protein HII13_004934 [Brettanomyces bruxellensis]|nr:hypothetical protein HII13_004934 [Brettanomyces bruxellensis]
MSDPGRKSFTDKATEAVTPDSQKSGFQKAKETVTNEADKIAAKFNSDKKKSGLQNFADNAQKKLDDTKGQIQKDNEAAKSGFEAKKDGIQKKTRLPRVTWKPRTRTGRSQSKLRERSFQKPRASMWKLERRL